MRTLFVVVVALATLSVLGPTWAADTAIHHPAVPQPSAGVSGAQPAATAPQCGMMAGMAMDDMMKMMENMHPGIAVDHTAVYIIRGGQVLKLDKKTLQVISQAMLPAMQMAAMPPAVGGVTAGGPGMQGMMQRPEMQQMMNKMMQMPSAQFDQSFLHNMIRHHAGAVSMSRVLARKASHSELRRFAQKVIDDQSREIREMSNWLKAWYKLSASPTPMPMDEQMTRELTGLSGKDLEIRYMHHMIMHHQEGIDMARMAEHKAAHPEAKTLASRIITSQTTEIGQLTQWLSAWYGAQP